MLLWWLADPALLSPRARRVVESSEALVLSPISFWEVGMLVTKGRVELDRPTVVWANDVLASERIALASLTPATAIAAAELDDFHGDPADRLIVAAAIGAGATLVTKDRTIRRWAAATKRVSCTW